VPGIYEVAPGDTLDAVITRAGGLTPSAYLYGAVFVRESTRKLQQANLDAVKRLLMGPAGEAGRVLSEILLIVGAKFARPPYPSTASGCWGV